MVQLLLSSRAKNATEGHLENFSSVLKRSKESKQAVKTIFFGLEAEMQFGERLRIELQPDQLEHSDFDTLEGETEHFEG